jgi:hypothetical protein
VVKPCNPQEQASSSRKIASLTAKRAPAHPCPPNPLSVAVEASSMSPVVPGHRASALLFRGLEGWPLYRDLRAAADVSAAVPC